MIFHRHACIIHTALQNRLKLSPVLLRASMAQHSTQQSTTSQNTMTDDDKVAKRPHDETLTRPVDLTSQTNSSEIEEPAKKCAKVDPDITTVYHDRNRLVPKHILSKLTPDDIDLLQNVTASCDNLDRVMTAVQLRKKHRLCLRLADEETDSLYYIENCLRKVYPYNFMFQAFTKQRWLGKKLKDVMKQEFRDIPNEDLEQRFKDNKVLVDGEPVSSDHVLKDNTLVMNFTHRHELPILAAPLKIIYEDQQTLVIDKPPSVPIHPCGRYNYNSVSRMLENEHKYHRIKQVHRLDRLVSGVLIMAKNSDRARYFEKEISSRNVMKEYVCRVDGRFPEGKTTEDGWILVDQPLLHLPGKISLMVVDKCGKSSSTKFKRLSYNGKSSVVLCRPLTGRMHQIRVHLQYLGYPISNDSLYNDDVFGPERGKGGKIGKSHAQLLKDVLNLHRATTWLISDDPTLSESTNGKEQNEQDYGCTVPFLNSDERQETLAALGHYFEDESLEKIEQKFSFDSAKVHKSNSCSDCLNQFHDPPLRRMFMYLHALRYSGTGWCYESAMPIWARDDWKY